jgi:PAS domain S-box-containing protein
MGKDLKMQQKHSPSAATNDGERATMGEETLLQENCSTDAGGLTLPENLGLREMLETLPVAFYVTDADGRLIYFNRAAVALSGRVPEIGTDKWCIAWKLFDAGGAPLPHDRCPMAAVLMGKKVEPGQECIAERPDGSRFWFTPYPTILRDADGRIVGGMNMLVDITARKVAHAQSEAEFRAIFEATPECVKIVASDGKLLQMNASGLSMIGAPSAQAVVGKSVYDLVAPEDRERFREFNEKVCRGEKISLEFEILGLENNRLQVETHATPLSYSDGTTVHLAVTRDVSERKRAEQAALLLSSIVDSSDDAIVSKNLNGVITSWNRSAERMFGYTAAEAVGQSVAALLIPPDCQNEESDILARLKKGERIDHFETKRKRKDGALLDISLTISPVRGLDGRVIGASKIARDLTSKKQVERTALLLSSIVDSSDDAILSKDLNGVITSWNKSAERIFGYTATEAVGRPVATLLIPADRQEEEPNILTKLRHGERVDHFETKRKRKDGTLIDVSLTISPVKAPDGTIIGASKIARDVTDQIRSQRELTHSNASLTRSNADLKQFAYSASHDLQEPLRMVSAYSEMLRRKFGNLLGSAGEEYLGFVIEGAQRMEQLLRDLRTYTHTSTVDDGPAPVVNPETAIERSIANLRPSIEESGAEITFDPLPPVRIHEFQLEQLFQNLIGNAIRYRSRQRPRIELGSEPEGDAWKFFIRDNGIGIDPEYKEQIFGIFKRLHTSSEYSGTGMGLAICQRIVERAGGRIWVESQLGRGSTFYFTLPVAGSAPVTHHHPQAAHRAN